MSLEEWALPPIRTKPSAGEELNEDKALVINWGLGSQELNEACACALIYQDGEQLCALKQGPWIKRKILFL